MPDKDFKFKAAMVLLLVLGGIMVYKLYHPATTFAVEGVDPNWDAAARRSHELAAPPAVVLFTAGWCPACQALHNHVLSRNDVQEELRQHFCFYTVGLTEPSPQAREHARKCRVSAIPLMIRYDANGKETDRANYLDGARMMAWLKEGE